MVLIRQLIHLVINPRQRRLRALWRLGLHLLILATMALSLIPILEALAIAGVDTDFMNSVFAAGLIQSGILILGTWIGYRLLDRRRIRLSFDRHWWSNLLFGLGLGAVGMTGIFAVQWSLGWVAIQNHSFTDDQSALQGLKHIAAWTVMFTCVGIAEELFSRGYQLKNLSEGFRCLGNVPAAILATVLTSAFFGFLHLSNPNASWLSSLNISMAGVLLAFARIATGSMAAPIGIHITWNLFQGAVCGFPVSGQPIQDGLVQIDQLGPDLWTGGNFGPEAGLVGVVTMLLMIAATLVWSLRVPSSWAHRIAALTHFQRRQANSLSSAQTAQPATADEPASTGSTSDPTGG